MKKAILLRSYVELLSCLAYVSLVVSRGYQYPKCHKRYKTKKQNMKGGM